MEGFSVPASVPAFYGLPKIHKPAPFLVRPIVSSTHSVTYNVAKHIAGLLSPLVGKTQHHTRNIQDFVNKISTVNLDQSEVITSYDVCALFTCIPPKDAVEVVRRKLTSDSTLSERTSLTVDDIRLLLELCLNTTYFIFGKSYYKQQYGCAMGSPVSPIVVNLYMEEFEGQTLSSFTGTGARIWYCYVDDTFVVIKSEEETKLTVTSNSLRSVAVTIN